MASNQNVNITIQPPPKSIYTNNVPFYTSHVFNNYISRKTYSSSKAYTLKETLSSRESLRNCHPSEN